MPILNVAILFDLAGLSRVLLLLFLVPAANLLVLPGVAGCIAAKSGRAPWVWWIAGIPLIHIVGLPILAFTCRSVPGPAPAPDATESAIRAMAAEGVADSEMQTLLNAKGLGGPTGGQSPHDLRERRKVQFSDDYATRMPSI